MTTLTFDIVTNITNTTLISGFKTYLKAKARADEIGNCHIKTVYHTCQCDYKPTLKKNRLVAKLRKKSA